MHGFDEIKKMGILKKGYLFLLIVILTACGERDNPAPVVELTWQRPGTHVGIHKVKRGETLYAVAFRYDQDFRQLAAFNHLQSPYHLRVGQILRLQKARKQETVYVPKFRVKPQNTYIAQKNLTVFRKPVIKQLSSAWLWPAQGRLVGEFLPSQGKKGIDIAGKKGDKIFASAKGVVAYAGAGLAGYGNLIIIKHNDSFLTAYANNKLNLVKEGQHIQAGQMIAEMGLIDRRYWGVHFEIRKAGHPVNPLSYLKRG